MFSLIVEGITQKAANEQTKETNRKFTDTDNSMVVVRGKSVGGG